MKRFITAISSILMAIVLLSSCGENDVKQNSKSETLSETEFSSEELVSTLDKHIEEIWTVYKPIKKILERLERFKLW